MPAESARRPFALPRAASSWSTSSWPTTTSTAPNEPRQPSAIRGSNRLGWTRPIRGAIEAALAEHRIDAVMGATDPRFTMPIFRAALARSVHYLDLAMSLSLPHPSEPFALTGVKLGDEQFALASEWEA